MARSLAAHIDVYTMVEDRLEIHRTPAVEAHREPVGADMERSGHTAMDCGGHFAGRTAAGYRDYTGFAYWFQLVLGA